MSDLTRYYKKTIAELMCENSYLSFVDHKDNTLEADIDFVLGACIKELKNITKDNRTNGEEDRNYYLRKALITSLFHNVLQRINLIKVDNLTMIYENTF